MLTFGVAFTFFGLVAAGPVDPSVCQLDYDPGPCRAFANVIAFDRQTGKCVARGYGGCKGNGNRFESIKECESTCKDQLKEKFTVPNPICLDQPIKGRMSCMAYIPRITFNAEEGKCVPYIYGGCFGSENLFTSEEDCFRKCVTGEDEDNTETPELAPRSADPDVIQFPESSDPKSAEVCKLRIDPGPCKAEVPLFGFNPTTARCEKFKFGGCKGNENRFDSITSCVETCGGNRPDEKLDCSGITCDAKEAEFNRAKGCQPVTRPGDCCPSSWNCPLWDQYRNMTATHCFFASKAEPNGRLYAIGEDIETGDTDGCSTGCFCSEGLRGPARIVCAMKDCFHPPSFSFDSCVPEYKSVGACCPTEYHCEQDIEALAVCQLDGKTYRAGEKMIPAAEPCTVCMCNADWDGNLAGANCQRMECGLGYSPKLADGCTPMYTNGDRCCPSQWLCPGDIATDSQTLIESAEARENTDSDRPVIDASTSTALKSSDACFLPRDPGPCEAIKPRFYFDKSAGKCVPFNYGGCKGNSNNFETEFECNDACNEYANPDPLVLSISKAGRGFPGKAERCNEPVKVGVCRSRVQQYFYNSNTGKCDIFFYSGCRGTANRFDTLKDCVKTCVPAAAMLRRPLGASAIKVSNEDICSKPVVTGRCRAFKPRWFFDQDKGTCQKFVYGGCSGNENNFGSEEECLSACGSNRPTGPLINVGSAQTLPERVPGRTPPALPPLGGGISCPGCPSPSVIDGDIKKVAVLASRMLTAHETVAEKCGQVQLKRIVSAKKQVVAGTNYFLELEMSVKIGSDCSRELTKTCNNIVVHKPLPHACTDDAMCLSVIRETEITCYGDDDLLIDPVELEQKNQVQKLNIEPVDQPSDDVCSLEREIGDCKAALLRYAFNKDTNSCQQFIYGGCRGNENNFVSQEECEKRCMATTPRKLPSTPKTVDGNRCSEPSDIGRCRLFSVRYFYNQQSRQCEEFQYGGCGGNRNNFPSKEECEAACKDNLDLAISGPPARCELGNETYAIGDVVRFNNNPCQSCVCSSPPSLTCTLTKCPLIAGSSRRRQGCEEVRDEEGCCVTGYQCPNDQLPGIPGGIPGGLAGSAITPEVKKVAARAQLQLADLHVVTGAACSHMAPRLAEILTAERQVVAGTNFKLRLRFRVAHGPRCHDALDRFCHGIVVHRPLGCTEDNYRECLQILNPDGISCHETQEEMEAASGL